MSADPPDESVVADRAANPVDNVEKDGEEVASAEEIKVPEAAEASEEVKNADESKMETNEETETPALVQNPFAAAAGETKNVESNAMDTEERLFYESVKDSEAETAEETAAKPGDEVDSKPVEQQTDEPERDDGLDMDKLDFEEDGDEDMIHISTDDISFDEPPKPTSEPKVKAKPISAPDTDNGFKSGTVTGTIIQFNDEHVLFEFSAKGCRGLIGVVETKHLWIPSKPTVSGSAKDIITFIKVCYQSLPLFLVKECTIFFS